MDHHFTERHPGHMHVYQGGKVTGHTHPYQEPHSHGDHGHIPGGQPLGSDPPGDVLFLTPQESLGTSITRLVIPAHRVEVVFPDQGDHVSLLPTSGDGHIPSGAFVPPLWRPPRG